MMKNFLVFCTVLLLSFSCNRDKSAILTPRLEVSENGRYLVNENGDPFFWLGDTGWLLLQKLSREEAGIYFADRRKKGFNVIQAVVIHDINRSINLYGDSAISSHRIDLPVVTAGRSQDDSLQYDYWDHMDYIVDLAFKNGLYLALVPVWGSNVRSGKITEEQAAKYAGWLVSRYGREPNIIWLNGGDVRGSDFMPVWNAIGNTLHINSPDQLVSYHPFGRTQSSEWFHNSDWLDFNMFQSGHRRYDQDTAGLHYGEDNWRYMEADYMLQPVKPSMDGEPSYESIPQGLHDTSQPYWTNNDVRRYAYWSVFAGGCGFTYGNNAIMQFYKKGDKNPAYGVKEYWEEALFSPGASEMIFLKDLVLSRPYDERIPAQELLASNGEKYDRTVVSKGKDYVFAYTYTGQNIEINAILPGWDQFKASWYNPRTGNSEEAGIFKAGQVLTFDPPGNPAPGNDWVLVLDAIR